MLVLGLLIGPPQAGQAQGTLDQRVAMLEGKLARASVANGGADIIRGANLNIINGGGQHADGQWPGVV
jgi:O-acetylhomoserine/O-acetylserine sulfhydrylase-like pyridoxal-dependent enzyme